MRYKEVIKYTAVFFKMSFYTFYFLDILTTVQEQLCNPDNNTTMMYIV